MFVFIACFLFILYLYSYSMLFKFTVQFFFIFYFMCSIQITNSVCTVIVMYFLLFPRSVSTQSFIRVWQQCSHSVFSRRGWITCYSEYHEMAYWLHRRGVDYRMAETHNGRHGNKLLTETLKTVHELYNSINCHPTLPICQWQYAGLYNIWQWQRSTLCVRMDLYIRYLVYVDVCLLWQPLPCWDKTSLSQLWYPTDTDLLIQTTINNLIQMDSHARSCLYCTVNKEKYSQKWS